VPETISVKTHLRPDYYEWFPLFSAGDLSQRLNYLPMHLATLLGYENMVQLTTLPGGADQVTRFLASSFEDQREMQRQVMRSVGVDALVADAVATVPREEFVPPGNRPFSYLNSYVPCADQSGLTGAGLVALMLASLPHRRLERIVEVGCGSGYHAACLAALRPGAIHYTGFEIDPDVCRFGRSRVLAVPFASAEVICGDALQFEEAARDADALVATASAIGIAGSSLAWNLPVGATLQEVRAITAKEFESEPAGSWLRSQFVDHPRYLAGEWRRYCCIATSTRLSDGFDEQNVLYDVRFVPLRSANAPAMQADARSRTDAFVKLRALL
jgi:protein-L-isoaspartate(D-aspartate) O-methyltransferase